MSIAHADTPAIEGFCDRGFEAVRDAFAANFAERDEIGAAVALSVGGRVVVDIWGGWADAERRRLWQRDTLVNFFSVGKAFATIGALRLVQKGALDLDAPVARYWDEFAAAGKHDISLRQILCHSAGLPAVREPLPEGSMLDWAAMTAALERQTPWWEPGTAHGYHVNTFGYLVGELVRRLEGRTIGALLRAEVAAPLGADVHIGLPATEHPRVADFVWPASTSTLDPSSLEGDDLMRWCAYFNPSGISGAGCVNSAAWRSAEIPSTNGHGTARGVARVYAALANGGAIDGVRILERDLLAEAVREHSAGMDRISKRASRFGLGFQLTQPERPLGPNAGGFGHFGAGGAVGFCDPEAGVALGYVMNEMGPRWQNPRNRALIDAVYECL